MNKIYFNNQTVKLEYGNSRLNKQTLYFTKLKHNVFLENRKFINNKINKFL